MTCQCNAPANVAYNVCGVCLKPLHVGQNPMTPEKKEPRVMSINEQAEREALEKFPVVMVDTGAKGIKYDPNYPNRKNFEEKRLLQLQVRELEEANKRQGAAIEKLKEQRNTQALKANPNFEEEFILGLVKNQYDSEIEAILNPTMEK
jgi:hypothetical protein